jgi:hypothetical protein
MPKVGFNRTIPATKQTRLRPQNAWPLLTGQLRYDSELKKLSFYWAFGETVKKVENKTVYYKKKLQCLQIIFLPTSQRRVHCHAVKMEPDQNETLGCIPL